MYSTFNIVTVIGGWNVKHIWGNIQICPIELWLGIQKRIYIYIYIYNICVCVFVYVD